VFLCVCDRWVRKQAVASASVLHSAAFVAMQVPAMLLRPGQLVWMHSMLGLVEVVNGKTGVLKHTSQSVWVVMLEEPCVIGLHKKHELRIHPKYLTGLSQLLMLFSEKLQAALVAERQEILASGALQMVRHIVLNPLAEAVNAGHTNVYDETVLLAFNTYLTECGVVVSTTAGSATMAGEDQQSQEIADLIEQQILAAFEARVESLGLRHKHRDAPDYVLITALSAEYRSACLAHHTAHHAAKQQQNDDALHKFISKVHPCHNEGVWHEARKMRSTRPPANSARQFALAVRWVRFWLLPSCVLLLLLLHLCRTQLLLILM